MASLHDSRMRISCENDGAVAGAENFSRHSCALTFYGKTKMWGNFYFLLPRPYNIELSTFLVFRSAASDTTTLPQTARTLHSKAILPIGLESPRRTWLGWPMRASRRPFHDSNRARGPVDAMTPGECIPATCASTCQQTASS